jgi:hypothetical protein
VVITVPIQGESPFKVVPLLLTTLFQMVNSTNITDDDYEYEPIGYDRIFLEVFTLVGLLSVAANFFIVFVVLKYKKLREDATNLIFLHVNILQAAFLLGTPLTTRVMMMLTHVTSVHGAVFCALYQIEISVMFAATWFLFLMVCDWYIKLYHKETYVKFCRFYKFGVAAVYVLALFTTSITVQLCFQHYMFVITYIVMVASVALFVLFLIVMNILHAVKKRRITVGRSGTYGLAITNIFFLLWFPSVILIIVTIKVVVNTPLFFICLLPLGFSTPIFNLIYLYNFDDNYNVFLKQVFKCRCNKYSNETLEDQPVSYNDVNGVQISQN